MLGYASGIGAPAVSSTPNAAPPAATTPSSLAESTPPASAGDAPGGTPGAGVLPPIAGGPGVFYPGGTGQDHTGHTGDSSHTGHGTTPAPPGSTPPPSPSDPATTPPPTDGDGDGTCEDGEVRVVRPLLTGLTEPVFGLLNPTAEASPTPQPSPCVGLPPLSSLLGGTNTPTPALSPEATP